MSSTFLWLFFEKKSENAIFSKKFYAYDFQFSNTNITSDILFFLCELLLQALL